MLGRVRSCCFTLGELSSGYSRLGHICSDWGRL